MRRAPLLLLLLAACSADPPQNPRTLWLGPGQSELDLVLVEAEPPPY